MADPGRDLRQLFEEHSRPIDPRRVAAGSSPIGPARRVSKVALVTLSVALLLGGTALFVRRADNRLPVGATTPTTLLPDSTVAPAATQPAETDTNTQEAAAADREILPASLSCSAELLEHPCTALFDSSTVTTWQATNGGIGVEIRMGFEQPVSISRLGFANATVQEAFVRNARVREVEVRVAEQSESWFIELDDSNTGVQWLELGTTRTEALTMTIHTSYPGNSFDTREPFNEVALAEIVVLGAPNPAEQASNEALLPFLGIDLPEWRLEFIADEGATTCDGFEDQAAVVYGGMWIKGSGDTQIRSSLTIMEAAPWCGAGLPTDPAQLAPPVGAPGFTEHEQTVVMGNEARVVSENGAFFFVLWLVSDVAQASLLVEGPGATLEEAYEAAGGVVRLTEDEWVALGGTSRSNPEIQPLVIGSIETSPGQTLLECRDASGVLLSPNRSGEIGLSLYSTPLAAFKAFIATHAADLFIARTGYVELGQPDGSVIYGKPLMDSDLDLGYVTLVTAEPVDDQWTVTTWEGSGC